MKPQATNSELKATAVDATLAGDRVEAYKRENIQIREVYSCLTSCSQCSGVYIDSISGTMLRIICSCSCHREKQEALVQVGRQISNARNTDTIGEQR
jgi:hypothetical protein